MEELDCVKLIKPFDDLKVGTKGCIVLKYTENDFEVEITKNGEVVGLTISNKSKTPPPEKPKEETPKIEVPPIEPIKKLPVTGY